MKKVISVFLAMIMLLSVFGIMAYAEGQTGLSSEENGKWYYYKNGKIQTGWIKVVEKYDTWTYTTWYHADKNGVLDTGWQKIDGKWYYFTDEEYYAPSMVTGVEEIGGKGYFFDKSGVLQKGWAKYDDDVLIPYWFYADKNGVLVRGWQKIDGKWYYFGHDDEDWAIAKYMMRANGGAKIGKTVYIFDKNGVLTYPKAGWYKNVVKYSDGTKYTEWYYIKSDGTAKTGWKQLDGKWYYFDDDEGYMYSGGGARIGKKAYVFEKSGALTTKTGWVSIKHSFSDGTKHTYWYYVTKGGVAKTGWQQFGKKWYYFGEWGDMYTGIMCIEKGDTSKTYYFNSDGTWNQSKNGWGSTSYESYSDANSEPETVYNWYYFKNGVAITGWKQISKKWYYFDTNGEMMKNGTYDVDEKWESFDENGVWTGTEDYDF